MVEAVTKSQACDWILRKGLPTTWIWLTFNAFIVLYEINEFPL